MADDSILKDRERLLMPTMTLAGIYEAQKQYFDSFLIYKDIIENNPEENVEDKIDSLINKIFEDNNIHYTSLIDKIFDNNEKKYFKILSIDKFNSYSKAIEKKIEQEKVDQVNENEEVEEDTDQALILDNKDEEVMQIDRRDKVIDNCLEKSDWKDMRVQDLIKILDNWDKKDIKLRDISLKELLDFITELSK